MHQYPFLRPVNFYHEAAESLSGTSRSELRWHVRDSRVVIGRGTYGSPTIALYSRRDRVTIGQFCSIANEVMLLAGGEHHLDTCSTFPFQVYYGEDAGAVRDDPRDIEYAEAAYKGPIIIGNDVWIGYGAAILSGVRVGTGAVVGAKAVVAKDVPPYSVVVGNPGRVIRLRFPENVVERLLEIRWWDWKDDAIRKNHHLFSRSPLELLGFIDAMNQGDRGQLYREEGEDASWPLLESSPLPPRRIVRRIISDLVPPALVRMVRNICK